MLLRHDLLPTYSRRNTNRNEIADIVGRPFSGDKEDGPPVAWAIIWRGIYSNWYGRMIPYSLQKWGYVFWDVKRIVKTGGKQRL